MTEKPEERRQTLAAQGEELRRREVEEKAESEASARGFGSRPKLPGWNP